MSGNEINVNVKKNIDLPNNITVLVLGIISIVTCWCYGIVGIILGIIALVLAKKDNALYMQNSDLYTQSSYKNVQIGKVCAIIGLCISAMMLIFSIVYLFMAAKYYPWNIWSSRSYYY
ncbi:MAG TPA: CCC motif membrane protein [Bacteroidales bacterium]|nr:CCC motif membrane protein [Bacteroidales bacterium]